MSTTAPEATETVPQEIDQQDQAPKPTETVEFWKAQARENEKRAKANADAAKRLAEIEDAQKSEAEKATERLADAEQRVAQAEARALRRDVALDSGLTAEDAALLDTITDEDAMRKLAARLAGEKDVKRNHVPKEGNNPQPSSDPMREYARQVFQRAREQV